MLKSIVSILFWSVSIFGSQTKLLLDYFPNPNHVPLYVGIEKGFFKEEGIDLELLKSFSPLNVISTLFSDRVDMGIYYTPQLLKACATNDQIQIIGKLIDKPLQAIMSKDLLLQSIDGKTIFGSPGTTSDIISAYTKENEITCKVSKVNFDPIAAFATKRCDLISGVFWNIEPVLLAHYGIETKQITLQDLGVPSYPELVFIAKHDYLEKHTDFANRWQRALQKSIDYTIANSEECFSLYLYCQKDKGHQTKIWEKKSFEATLDLYAKKQRIDPKRMEALYVWMCEKEIIKKFKWKNHFKALLTD